MVVNGPFVVACQILENFKYEKITEWIFLADRAFAKAGMEEISRI